MRNLYLVRHATPDFKDGIKRCIGRTDIDIGEAGVLEAEKLRDFFRDKEIQAIYTSPLIRCVHTAEIIADGKQKVKIHEGLAEIYMGHWENQPLKDIKKELGDEPFDGEKRVDALVRMETALMEIMLNTIGDVLCVAHAGVNCAFSAKQLGKDIKTSRALRQPCGSYNHFEFDGKEFKQIALGSLPFEE